VLAVAENGKLRCPNGLTGEPETIRSDAIYQVGRAETLLSTVEGEQPISLAIGRRYGVEKQVDNG